MSLTQVIKMVLGFRRGAALNDSVSGDDDFERLTDKLPTKVLVRLPDRFESVSLVESRARYGIAERKVVSPEARLAQLLDEHRKEEQTMRRDARPRSDQQDWSGRTADQATKPKSRQQSELEDYNKSLELDNETLRAEVQSVHAQNQKLKKAKKSADSQLLAVQADLNKLHADFELMKAESMKTLAHEREKSGLLLQQAEELDKANSQLTAQLDEREAELGTAREELAVERAQNQVLATQNIDLQTRLTELSSQLAKRDAEAVALKQRYEDLDKFMAEVKQHKNSLQAKLDGSAKQVRDLEQLCEGQRQQVAALEQTVAALRGSEQELEGEVVRLEAELRHVHSVHDKDVAEAKTTLNSLTDQYQVLLDDKEVLLQDKDELSRELDLAYDTIDKLKHRVARERKERQCLEEQLEALEASLSRQLKSAKQQAVQDFQETALGGASGPQTLLALQPHPPKKVEIFL